MDLVPDAAQPAGDARQLPQVVLNLTCYPGTLVGADGLMFDRVATTLLFGLAANTDNLAIGFAYGMKQRRIRWQQNLFIAVVTTAVTLIAMALGRQIRELLPSQMPGVLGGALLLVFAAWNFYHERTEPTYRPLMTTSRFARRTSVGMGESLSLSGILSINNVGLAIAGGIGGISYISAAVSIFCFSVAMLALGQAGGSIFTCARSVPRALRYPVTGNAVLALAGVLMLAGF
jgi:putative Mn2+ efflux pump MntP